MLLSDPDLHLAVRTHALEVYPHECCGVVTDDGYQRLENVAKDPEHTFDCHDQLMPLLDAGHVRAFVHSHPDGPYAPSAFDMTQQIAMDVPWGLIATDQTGWVPLFFWGDQLDPPPLEGRGFRYGPSGSDGRGDCAALVRDWYRLERNITLKEFPREYRWWLKPKVSYRDNLIEAGFQPANPILPEVGDVFLATIRSSQPNHAGIYVGGGQILHHLENRLSRIEPSISWARLFCDWFRHEAV